MSGDTADDVWAWLAACRICGGIHEYREIPREPWESAARSWIAADRQSALDIRARRDIRAGYDPQPGDAPEDRLRRADETGTSALYPPGGCACAALGLDREAVPGACLGCALTVDVCARFPRRASVVAPTVSHCDEPAAPRKRLREVLDALGMDRTRDWGDVLNAARCLRKNAGWGV